MSDAINRNVSIDELKKEKAIYRHGLVVEIEVCKSRSK